MGDNPKSLQRAVGFPLWKLDLGAAYNLPTVSIPEMGASLTKNVVMYDGRLHTRPGFQLAVNTPLAIDPGYDATSSIYHLGYMVTQDQQYHLIRVQVDTGTGNMQVFQLDNLGVWNDITGTAFTFTASVPLSSAQFKGEWLGCFGNNNLRRWTGTGTLVDVTAAQTNAALKAPAQPYFVCATGSRVFLANAIDPNSGLRVPYRVWWSDTLNSGIWSNGAGLPAQGSAGFQDLTQGRDSSPVTGMYFQGATQVVVFKRHSLYRGVFKGGPVWYDFLPITQSRGCVAPRSVQCYNDTLVWLADDFNVYAMEMNGKITAIGDAVRPRIQQIFDPSYESGSGVTAVLDVVLGIYWLIIPQQGASVTSHILACNLRTGAWSEGVLAAPQKRIQSGFWLQPDPPFYVEAPIAIWGFNDGSIYALDHTNPIMTDVTTAWDAYWWSKTHDFMQLGKGSGETAEFHKIAIHGTSGMAVPRIRMGNSIAEVTIDKQLSTFTQMDLSDPDCPAYSSNVRAGAERFGQVGIYWPPGTRRPAVIEGITSWGLSRQETR